LRGLSLTAVARDRITVIEMRMLSNIEVVPVRASARDYNPVNKIGGNQFAGGRTQYGNVRWWPRNIHQSYESYSSAQVTCEQSLEKI